MKYVGIDIGSSTIRGLVYETQTSKGIDVAELPNDTHLPSGSVWEHTQDPNCILARTKSILNDLLSRHKRVKGIGITGQMHGILYLDRSGNPVSPLYTWLDRRGDAPLNGSNTAVDLIQRKTGYTVATGFGLVTHYYNAHTDNVPAAADRICTIGDYIALDLANLTEPIIEHSNAASLGLFNIQEQDFDRNSLEDLCLGGSNLPKLYIYGQGPIGQTPDGINVFPAIGDNQASFVGSVQDFPSSVLFNLGTGGQLSCYSKEYLLFPKLEIRPFFNKGYLLVGIALAGGQSFVLLKDFFIETLKWVGCEAKTQDFYEVMDAVDISLELNNDPPIVDTRFCGTREDPTIRGSIGNLTVENFTPQKITAAFMQGMVNELYNCFAILPVTLKKHIKTVVGSGNGVRKNRQIQELIKRRFNKPLILAQVEEAAKGAAIFAAENDR